MFCRQCGQSLSDHAKFCSKCGNPVQPPAPPVAPVQQPAGSPPAVPTGPATMQPPAGPPAVPPAGQAPIQPPIAPTGPATIQPPAGPPPAAPLTGPAPMQPPAGPPMGPPTGQAPIQQPVGPPIAGPAPVRQQVGPPIGPPSGPSAVESTPVHIPPVQLVTPADEGPERLLAQVPGSCISKSAGKTWTGHWAVTNKRLMLFEYDDYEEEEPFRLPPLESITEDDCFLTLPMRYVHSLLLENFAVSKEVCIYCYNDLKYTVDLGNKAFKVFVPAMETAIPGLLTVTKPVTSDYYPNMSELDPRNPLGENYNPKYPRGYVLAETKQLKENPRGIDDAIMCAKQAGILSPDWNILVKGISKTNLPPGVPVVVNASF